MTIKIVHENDCFVLYINGTFHGNYDSPVQAAMAAEELIDANNTVERKNQNGSI